MAIGETMNKKLTEHIVMFRENGIWFIYQDNKNQKSPKCQGNRCFKSYFEVQRLLVYSYWDDFALQLQTAFIITIEGQVKGFNLGI
jgi:hypothetical protein